MTVTAYEQFEQCRNINFLSKGKYTFLKFIKVDRDDPSQTQAEFNKMVQNLSFILKFIVKSAIEISILNEHSEEKYDQDTFMVR